MRKQLKAKLYRDMTGLKIARAIAALKRAHEAVVEADTETIMTKHPARYLLKDLRFLTDAIYGVALTCAHYADLGSKDSLVNWACKAAYEQGMKEGRALQRKDQPDRGGPHPAGVDA